MSLKREVGGLEQKKHKENIEKEEFGVLKELLVGCYEQSEDSCTKLVKRPGWRVWQVLGHEVPYMLLKSLPRKKWEATFQKGNQKQRSNEKF